MTTSVQPLEAFKSFGGIRYKNAVAGSFSYGYNFESFPASDTGYGTKTVNGNTLVESLIDLGYTGYGTFETLQSGTTYHLIYAVDDTDGRIFEWDGSNLTAIATGLTKTAINCNGIDFNNKFFFSNGVEIITIEMGSPAVVTAIDTTDALSRQPVGLGLWVYDNRIFMTSEYGISFCSNGDETDWATTGSAGAGYYNYYSPLTFVYGFSNGIIFGNKDFIDFLTGNGADNYLVQTIGQTGAVGHKAICSHAEQVYFFNGEGVYPVVYTDTNQRRIDTKISVNIDEAFNFIDTEKFADIQMISLADTGKNKVWLHARYTDNTSNSIMWIFDFNINEWFCRKQQIINYLSINNNLLFSVGDNLLQENSGTTFNGELIEVIGRMARIDFGGAVLIKKIKKALMLLTEGAEIDFYLKYIFDGDYSSYVEQRIEVNYSDILYWANDSETVGGVWADDAETVGGVWDKLLAQIKYILRPSKKFKLLEVEFSCRESGQQYSIDRLEFQNIKIKH